LVRSAARAAHSDLAWPVKKEILTMRRNTSLGWISSRRALPPIHGRVTPHRKGPAHRVTFLCCGDSLLDNDAFSEGSTRSWDWALNNIMETLSTAEVISKSRGAETNQTPDGQQYVPLGNCRDGRPCLTGFSWPGQSDQSPVRGHDESALMKSQLG
jgi:hypothetical protein